MSELVLSTNEKCAMVLANVLHELNPGRSPEQWLDHVKQTGHDAKLFFGDNGEGLAEYESFVRTFDKDNYDRTLKRKHKIKTLNRSWMEGN